MNNIMKGKGKGAEMGMGIGEGKRGTGGRESGEMRDRLCRKTNNQRYN